MDRHPMRLRGSFAGYGASLAAVALAVLLRILLDPLLGSNLPFVTVYLSVLFAGWRLGTGPALVALIASAMAAAYFFIEPRHSLFIVQPEYRVGMVAFLLVGVASIAMFASLRTAWQAVAERNDLLRITLASIGDGVITTDPHGRITSLNSAAEILTGWQSGEARGQPLDSVFRIVSEDSREPVENPVTKALREGTVVGLANHTVLIAKDGVERPIDDSAAPIRDDRGNVVGAALVFRDIVERRRSEKENAARLSAARLLASIVESSDDAIVSKSLDGTIQTWNEAACRLFGYTAEEAIGRLVTTLIPADLMAEEDQIIARIKAGQRLEHFETTRVRKDGTTVPVSLTISPVKDESGSVVGASKIARNISERKATEAVLRRQATIFENQSDAIIVTDLGGLILDCNPACERMLGYAKDEVLGRNTSMFHRPEDAETLTRNALAATQQYGFWQGEITFVRKDGTLGICETIVKPLTDEAGRAVGAVSVNRDITDRKRADEALAVSEERLRLAWMQAQWEFGIGTSALANSGGLTTWNRFTASRRGRLVAHSKTFRSSSTLTTEIA